MAKRKSTKGQTTIYKHTHKTKDRLTRSSITLITIHLHTIVMRSSAMCLANVIKAILNLNLFAINTRPSNLKDVVVAGI